ncbi:hypothetical protein R9C00_12825 [Flammeovirgaceae bacterium SG7u.111]|nr:hypothetical protein [Flammeovirgaceae bacterium SG7u.132]WPO38338.1 hypothetical protein R9C00_12825 [Flammeovirgaceae bacterium SG7u.111]
MENFKNIKKVNETWEYINELLADPSELAIANKAGYSKKSIDNALKLHDEIVELRQVREVMLGRQKSATDGVSDALIEIKKHYKPLLKIARTLFKNDREKIGLLDLEGRRSTKFNNIKLQYFAFYKMGMENPEIAAEFKKKNITQAHMQKGLDLFVDTMALKRIQQSAEVEYEQAREAVTVKTDELINWYNEAKNIIEAWRDIEIEEEQK